MNVTELEPGVVRVELTGEFDLWCAYEFDRALREHEGDALRSVTVDPRALTFVDTAGLARLIAANRRAAKHGWSFSVVRGCPAVEKLLCLAAVGREFDFVTAGEPVPA